MRTFSKRALRASAAVAALVFLTSATLLYLGFQKNQWSAASQRWFDSFDLGSEGLVIGRLCKSRHDGVFSAGGLTGSTGAGIDRQYREYLDDLEMKEFAPYRSQPGFQADFFAVLDTLSPRTPRENLRAYHALTAAASACALALLILWFHLELGPLCAVVVLLTTVQSQWLTVMGRSLWWCLGAYYLPWLCSAYGLLLEQRAGWAFGRHSVALIAGAVLAKCLLNGYEFIATTVLMALVPFVYHAFTLGWNRATLRARLAKAVAGIVLGASTGLCVLAFQLSCVDGSIGRGWANILDCLERRTVGRQVSLGRDGLPQRLPDLPETLARYLKGTAIDFNMLVNPGEIGDPRPSLQIQFRQLIFLFLGASALALLAVRQAELEPGERRRILGLVAATWFSILAPLSWFVLFMGHATVHFHLDHIVWHMPFTLYGFALCGVVVGLVLRPPPGPLGGHDTWSRTVSLVAWTAVLTLHAAAFARHTANGAFIAFRQVLKLTQGQGFACYLGLPPEGTAHPLWLALLTLGRRAGVEVELMSRALGLAAGLACLALVHHAARAASPHTDGPPVWMAAGLWTASCAPFAFWCASGLETALYALALTALPIAVHTGHRGVAAGVLAALLLMRPEASGAFAAPGPVSGIAYVCAGLTTVLSVPLVLLAAIGVWFRAHERSLFVLTPLVIAGHLVAVVVTGGDALPLGRLLVPLAPLTFLLAAAGLEIALKRAGPGFFRSRAIALFIVVLCAVKLAAVPAEQASAIQLQSALGALQEEVGAFLVRRAGRVAMGDTGRVAYRSRLDVIDFERAAPGGVLTMRPEWIALLSTGLPSGDLRGFSPIDDQLRTDPRLAADYLLVETKTDRERKLEYRIYRRRDASGDRATH